MNLVSSVPSVFQFASELRGKLASNLLRARWRLQNAAAPSHRRVSTKWKVPFQTIRITRACAHSCAARSKRDAYLILALLPIGIASAIWMHLRSDLHRAAYRLSRSCDPRAFPTYLRPPVLRVSLSRFSSYFVRRANRFPLPRRFYVTARE